MKHYAAPRHLRHLCRASADIERRAMPRARRHYAAAAIAIVYAAIYLRRHYAMPP